MVIHLKREKDVMEPAEYPSRVQRFALTKEELKDLKKNNERAEVVRIKERFQFLPFTSNEQAYDILANYEETVRTRNIKIGKRWLNLLLIAISALFILFAVAAAPIMNGFHIPENIQVSILAVSTGLGGAFSLTVKYLDWGTVASIYHTYLDAFIIDFGTFFENAKGKQGDEFNRVCDEFQKNFLQTQKSLREAVSNFRKKQYAAIFHSLPEKK
jgi:hypothetical protein